MVGAFFLCDVKRHLLVQWFPFFLYCFLALGGGTTCARTFSTNWATAVREKQRDIRIATGSSNRPPRGRGGRDLHRLHHTKNNTMTKIGPQQFHGGQLERKSAN